MGRSYGPWTGGPWRPSGPQDPADPPAGSILPRCLRSSRIAGSPNRRFRVVFGTSPDEEPFSHANTSWMWTLFTRPHTKTGAIPMPRFCFVVSWSDKRRRGYIFGHHRVRWAEPWSSMVRMNQSTTQPHAGQDATR